MLPPNINHIYADLVSVVPESALECALCGRDERVSADDKAHHLEHGWPTCCGKTMTLLSVERADIRGDARELERRRWHTEIDRLSRSKDVARMTGLQALEVLARNMMKRGGR